MKKAIIVLSDPKAGVEESTGRVFNALAAAYDSKQKGEDVKLIFQGAAAGWPADLTRPDHPLHQLYKAVEDKVAASCGHDDISSASHDVEAPGEVPVEDIFIPGDSGTLGCRNLIAEGYGVVTF